MRGYLYRVGRVNFRILNWCSSKNVCAAPAACLSNGESPARTTPNSAYARWPRPELSRSLSVRPYFCLPNGFAASNTGTIANLGIYIGGGYSCKHLFSSKGRHPKNNTVLPNGAPVFEVIHWARHRRPRTNSKCCGLSWVLGFSPSSRRWIGA